MRGSTILAFYIPPKGSDCPSMKTHLLPLLAALLGVSLQLSCNSLPSLPLHRNALVHARVVLEQGCGAREYSTRDVTALGNLISVGLRSWPLFVQTIYPPKSPLITPAHLRSKPLIRPSVQPAGRFTQLIRRSTSSIDSRSPQRKK
jgi:hypothetical protein